MEAIKLMDCPDILVRAVFEYQERNREAKVIHVRAAEAQFTTAETKNITYFVYLETPSLFLVYDYVLWPDKPEWNDNTVHRNLVSAFDISAIVKNSDYYKRYPLPRQ